MTDLIYASALYTIIFNVMPATNSLKRICLFLQLFCFVPLILVDHIHFQYNGILMGILLFCVVFTCRKQKIHLTQTFSTLVLMKHLFVPMAPLFGCVLLRICLDEEKSFFSGCLSLLPSVLIAVANLIFAFGPFVAFGGISQLTQIFSRLFPFGRGLVHAYWAPNLWAFYIFLDKILLFLCKRLKLPLSADLSNALSSSSGKVGVYGLAFFPQISAGHCLFMTLIAVLVASWWLFKREVTVKNVCRSLVFVSLSSFMFGYHVHEKAILIPLLLQTLLVHDSAEDQFLFLSLTMSGVISLFPLIPGQMELLIKGMFRRFRFFLLSFFFGRFTIGFIYGAQFVVLNFVEESDGFQDSDNCYSIIIGCFLVLRDFPQFIAFFLSFSLIDDSFSLLFCCERVLLASSRLHATKKL
jgi:alpha-1,3-glucosyltransferase